MDACKYVCMDLFPPVCVCVSCSLSLCVLVMCEGALLLSCIIYFQCWAIIYTLHRVYSHTYTPTYNLNVCIPNFSLPLHPWYEIYETK